jgi:drug/metabolite transporter (DMT)-like permease
VIGYVVWHHLPTAWVIAGAMIVVASGLYILWRETVRRRAAAASGDPG